MGKLRLGWTKGLIILGRKGGVTPLHFDQIQLIVGRLKKLKSPRHLPVSTILSSDTNQHKSESRHDSLALSTIQNSK
jgi:hypothetical protein